MTKTGALRVVKDILADRAQQQAGGASRLA